jgi:hypothetical protein
MTGRELQGPAEGVDRAVDIHVRLREAEREGRFGIAGRRVHERAGARHRFFRLPGLDQRENEVVGRLRECRTRGERGAMGVTAASSAPIP